MLTFQPRKPPRYRPRPAAPQLALVTATCDDAPALTLTFDRPVDVSALDVALIRVDIGVMGFTYVGHDAPIVTSPTTLQILLTGVEEYAGAGVILTAPANTGIVAAGGGAAWPGVSGLSLPFP
jgi:hypothetical protein